MWISLLSVGSWGDGEDQKGPDLALYLYIQYNTPCRSPNRLEIHSLYKCCDTCTCTILFLLAIMLLFILLYVCLGIHRNFEFQLIANDTASLLSMPGQSYS